MVIVFAFSLIIYVSGVMLSRRNAGNESNKRVPYMCGERPASLASRVIVSLYKYIIYFIILDSSLVIIAFASMALNSINVWPFSIYAIILLVSSLLLLEGEK